MIPANLHQNAYQSNPLIQAQKKMTLYEGKLFYLALLAQNPHLPNSKQYDEELRTTFIPTNDLFNTLNLKKETETYKAIKEAADKLVNKGVLIEDEKNPDGVWSAVPLFEIINFNVYEGGMTVKFNQHVKKHILELSDTPYTRIAGADILSLNSSYGMRILELMLQYQNMAQYKNNEYIERDFELKELRDYLGVTKMKTYACTSNIKKWVLNVAKKDIKQNSEYEFDYLDIKLGRKITGFKCRLYKPKVEKTITPEHIQDMGIKFNNYETVDKLVKYGISRNIANKLASEYDEDRIHNNIDYAMKQKRVKNLPGYIRKAIEQDFYTDRVLSKRLAEAEKKREKQKAKERHEANGIIDGTYILAPEPESEPPTELPEIVVNKIKSLVSEGKPIARLWLDRLKPYNLTVEDVLAGLRKKDVAPEIEPEISEPLVKEAPATIEKAEPEQKKPDIPIAVIRMLANKFVNNEPLEPMEEFIMKEAGLSKMDIVLRAMTEK